MTHSTRKYLEMIMMSLMLGGLPLLGLTGILKPAARRHPSKRPRLDVRVPTESLAFRSQ